MIWKRRAKPTDNAPEDCTGKSTVDYEELRRKERYGRMGAGAILASVGLGSVQQSRPKSRLET